MSSLRFFPPPKAHSNVRKSYSGMQGVISGGASASASASSAVASQASSALSNKLSCDFVVSSVVEERILPDTLFQQGKSAVSAVCQPANPEW